MSKGSKISTTDMQMRVLNSFDRELRNGGHHTSGLLRNEETRNWRSVPTASRLTGTDARIAALKAEIAEMDHQSSYRS